MRRRGNRHDNVAMESFWSTLKLAPCRRLFYNHRDTQSEIFDHIEVFYNRHRRHASLGGLSLADLDSKTTNAEP